MTPTLLDEIAKIVATTTVRVRHRTRKRLAVSGCASAKFWILKKQRHQLSAPKVGEQIRMPWHADANSRPPACGIVSRRTTNQGQRTPSRDAQRCRTEQRSSAPWRLLPWPCRCAPRAACRMRQVQPEPGHKIYPYLLRGIEFT